MAEMAYKMPKRALKAKAHRVNIFLYLDAVQYPPAGQNPVFFANAGELFAELSRLGQSWRPVPGVLQHGVMRPRMDERWLCRGDQGHQPLPPGGDAGGER